MKRVREEDDCFLGDMEWDEYEIEILNMPSFRHFITRVSNTCVVVSKTPKCITSDWTVTIESSRQQVECLETVDKSIPYTRADSVKFGPMIKQKRENHIQAVYTWILCARRLELHKDVIRLIAEMV